MPQYRINETSRGAEIELTAVGDRQDELLQSFGECAAGRCTCPTDEYQKLATMDIRPRVDRIDIELEAKAGEWLDPTEIAACLDHIVADR